MNKSLITNVVALALMGVGYFLPNHYAFYAGLFAFSGAITNWLAIHMLFEKTDFLGGITISYVQCINISKNNYLSKAL